MNELQDRLALVEWGAWRVDTADLAPNPDLYPDRAPDVEVRDRALIDYHWHPDGLAWQHRVYAWLMGNDTGIVHEVINAAGQLVRTLTTPMPRINGLPMKIDRLNISQSGRKMVYAVAAHEVSSSPTRLVWGGTLVIEDICHPYPGGQPEQGRDVPSELIGSGGGGGSEPSLTEEQVKDASLAALREALNAATNAAIFGRWQKAAENGAKVAVREEGVITTANMGAAYAASYQVQQQLDNRVFAVLRDQRVLEAVAAILGDVPEAAARDLRDVLTPAQVAAAADEERAAWEAAQAEVPAE